MSVYEIRDEDVASVLRYLKLSRPNDATEAVARQYLMKVSKNVHQQIQDKALLDPEHFDEDIDAVLEQLKRK